MQTAAADSHLLFCRSRYVLTTGRVYELFLFPVAAVDRPQSYILYYIHAIIETLYTHTHTYTHVFVFIPMDKSLCRAQTFPQRTTYTLYNRQFLYHIPCKCFRTDNEHCRTNFTYYYVRMYFENVIAVRSFFAYDDLVYTRPPPRTIRSRGVRYVGTRNACGVFRRFTGTRVSI